MPLATITPDPDHPGFVLVRFAYDPAAVAEVKRLPSRRWDKPRRTWMVPYDLRRQARHLLEQIGYRVEDECDDTTGPMTAADAIAVLVDAVPEAQRRGLLRKLAASTHPDVGGDGALSRIVNRLLDGTP